MGSTIIEIEPAGDQPRRRSSNPVIKLEIQEVENYRRDRYNEIPADLVRDLEQPAEEAKQERRPRDIEEEKKRE